ncbi:MAG: TolC family protein [Gemmatimonadota bacterium]
MSFHPMRRIPAGVWLMLAVMIPLPLSALQSGPDSLAELLDRVLGTHPALDAARGRADAAYARVLQAGALPDPTVGVALRSLPLSSFDPSAEGMTMLAFEGMQRLPPRGLRAARSAEALAWAQAADSKIEIVNWDLTVRLSEAYFELLLVEEALVVHHRTVSTLEAFAASAEAAYTEGLAPQQDMLRAQTELAVIEEHLAQLRQRQGRALAELNTMLDRDLRASLQPEMPERLERLIASDPGLGMLTTRLTDAELGPGYQTLAELEEQALTHRPELRLAELQVEAARHRVEAARRDRRPAIALTGGYGMRSGRSDVVSLGVSVELPVHRDSRQDLALDEARGLAEAERQASDVTRRDVQREVGQAHAELIEARERLILLSDGVIPQARAAVESAAAAYRTGAGDFVRLMEVQTVLFRNEIQRAHLTADLGRMLVRLERSVGAEIQLEADR